MKVEGSSFHDTLGGGASLREDGAIAVRLDRNIQPFFELVGEQFCPPRTVEWESLSFVVHFEGDTLHSIDASRSDCVVYCSLAPRTPGLGFERVRELSRETPSHIVFVQCLLATIFAATYWSKVGREEIKQLVVPKVQGCDEVHREFIWENFPEDAFHSE